MIRNIPLGLVSTVLAWYVRGAAPSRRSRPVLGVTDSSAHAGCRLLNPSGWLLLIASVLAIGATGQAGELLLSGDVTPVFSLTNATPSPATPGNQRFFTNILNGGTAVVIRNSAYNPAAAPELNQFYNSLSGVTSTLVAAPVTTSQLVGADLFIAPIPDTAFSASEGIAIAGVLNSGGAVLLIGESQGIAFAPSSNAHVNALLGQLGSGLTLVSQDFDLGPQMASGSSIAAHPLTSGVTVFNYGSASEAVGGTPLFLTQNGTPFFALESSVIPEPTAATILALGLVPFLCSRFGRGQAAICRPLRNS